MDRMLDLKAFKEKWMFLVEEDATNPDSVLEEIWADAHLAKCEPRICHDMGRYASE
jgi:hypothetical protein